MLDILQWWVTKWQCYKTPPFVYTLYMVHMYIFTKYLHIIHIDVFSDVSKSQVGAFSDIDCTSVSAFVINFDLLYRKCLSLMVLR